VVNVKNPVHPAGFSFHRTSGSALDVAVQGEFIYIADADGELSISRFQMFKFHLPLVERGS